MDGTVTNTDMTAITTAFTEAVGVIKTNTIAMVAVALGAGLAIVGVVCATKAGIKFIRNLANG